MGGRVLGKNQAHLTDAQPHAHTHVLGKMFKDISNGGAQKGKIFLLNGSPETSHTHVRTIKEQIIREYQRKNQNYVLQSTCNVMNMKIVFNDATRRSKYIQRFEKNRTKKSALFGLVFTSQQFDDSLNINKSKNGEYYYDRGGPKTPTSKSMLISRKDF